MSAMAQAVAQSLQFGAIELKQNYKRYLTRALIIAVGAHFVVIGGLKVAGILLAKHEQGRRIVIVRFTQLNAPPSLSKTPPPPVAVAPNVLPPTVGNITPVPEAQAPKEQTIASQQEIQQFNPAATSSGSGDSLVISAPPDEGMPAYGEFVYYEEGPVRISMPQARYPDLAREAGLEGTVKIQAQIGKDGQVHDTKIVKSIPMLDESAREAVLRSTWKPALNNNKPVACWVEIPVNFRLN